MNEIYERVKTRFHLGDNYPYWAIPYELLAEELAIWKMEIVKEVDRLTKLEGK